MLDVCVCMWNYTYRWQQPTEEDPDEGIKDLVEITLKKMVSRFMMLLMLNPFIIWSTEKVAIYRFCATRALKTAAGLI